MVVAQILGGVLASLVVEGVVRGKGRLEVGNNTKELRDGITVCVEAVGTAVVTLVVLVVSLSRFSSNVKYGVEDLPRTREMESDGW